MEFQRKGTAMFESDELFEEMSVPESEKAFAGHSCFSAATEFEAESAE
ncbi:azolemycin family RiPP peptide [Streptomyces sp. NPDC088725]